MKYLLVALVVLCLGCGQPETTAEEVLQAHVDSTAEAAEQEAEAQRVAGVWQSGEEVSPFDGSKRLSIWRHAVDEGESSSIYALHIRCTNSTREVYINWDEYLSDGPEVTLRWDDGAPMTSTWTRTSDQEMTLYPGGNVMDLIGQAVESDTLVVEMASHGQGTKVGRFSLAGIGEAMAPMGDACGLRVGQSL